MQSCLPPDVQPREAAESSGCLIRKLGHCVRKRYEVPADLVQYENGANGEYRKTLDLKEVECARYFKRSDGDKEKRTQGSSDGHGEKARWAAEQ